MHYFTYKDRWPVSSERNILGWLRGYLSVLCHVYGAVAHDHSDFRAHPVNEEDVSCSIQGRLVTELILY